MIENILREIGLTQNEIKVYMALLDLGESKTGDILKKSGLNSGKIYEILSSLQKRGLVSFTTKSGVKYFSPANPKRLLDYLEEKKENIEKQEEDYKEILPQLMEKVSSSKSETKVEIFTGLKGMKNAYLKELEFSKSNTVYVLGVGSPKKYKKEIWDFFVNNLEPKRKENGNKVKKLLAEDARGTKKHHGKKTQIRFLPHTSFVTTNIVGNLTTIGIFAGEPLIISIESEEVADNFKKQFDSLWEVAKD